MNAPHLLANLSRSVLMRDLSIALIFTIHVRNLFLYPCSETLEIDWNYAVHTADFAVATSHTQSDNYLIITFTPNTKDSKQL